MLLYNNSIINHVIKKIDVLLKIYIYIKMTTKHRQNSFTDFHVDSMEEMNISGLFGT